MHIFVIGISAFIFNLDIMISKSSSSAEIVSIIGERFREYRLAALLTQQEVADIAGVSKTTVYSFENGRLPNVSFRTVVDLLRAIGMIDKIDDILPEIPISPYLMSSSKKQITKVYHKRNGKQ